MKPFLLCLFAAFGLNASVQLVFQEKPNPPVQFHEAVYRLGWDVDFSPYSGGEDVLFAHRILERTEGYFIGKSPIYYSKQAAARAWRTSELIFIWLPLNYLATVAQHEVFGHGYRIRDIPRARVSGYSFGTPPPYGSGGGSTSYYFSSNFTTTEETSVAMAGVESTAILAQITKLKWLQVNWIDPRQSVLYLLCQQDLNLYIGTLKTEGSLDGHDIKDYIHSLNYTYPSSFLSGSTLRNLSWINLADPFTFYSIYSWFHYLSSGKESKIPMIPLWDWGYLPGVRLGLTPFGPEFFVENYLLKGNKPVYFYVKGGEHAKNDYYGIGFYAPTIWNVHRWSFGARFDAWRQPKLLLSPGNVSIYDIDFDVKPDKNDPLYPYSEQFKVRYGAAGSLVFAYQSKRSGLESEFGYKAQGFLPGYSLRASPVIRLFYALLF